MKTTTFGLLAILSLGAVGCSGTASSNAHGGPLDKLKLETLHSGPSGFAKDVDIVMSRVHVPANTALPTHYHPGEEYIYVLEGSGTLTLKGKSATKMQAGDFFKVPYKAVHTFVSGSQGARAVVCRVHDHGQPERVPQ